MIKPDTDDHCAPGFEPTIGVKMTMRTNDDEITVIAPVYLTDEQAELNGEYPGYGNAYDRCIIAGMTYLGDHVSIEDVNFNIQLVSAEVEHRNTEEQILRLAKKMEKSGMTKRGQA